jgi:hypothetical protein
MEAPSKLMEVYGPGIWWVIHQDSKAGDKQAVIRHIMSVPCEDCKSHAESYMRKYPIPEEGQDLFKWSVDFHNAVNSRLGRPIFSLEEAEIKYSQICKQCSTENIHPVVYIPPLILESRSGPKSILKNTADNGTNSVRSRNRR